MSTGVLYISYTGLLEPLGQSQVLAYQERLSAIHPVHIISFERKEDLADAAKVAAIRERTRRAGIHWHVLRYHKRPSALATLWDIAIGAATGIRLVRRHGLGIVHARSYVASAMALLIKRMTGARYLFDMRGFWADERVDGGLWPRGGRMYRVAKWFERMFLLNADHVVSLTNAAKAEVARFDYLHGRIPPTTVIPTCADLDRFCPLDGRRDDVFVLGYVGSVGTWYLFDAAVAAFIALRAMRPDARLLVINRGGHDHIRERLAVAGVPAAAFELCTATHAEVPAQMARMHAGVFFYKPSYSRLACAPTKLGEFLGCGIPCLANAGVGDTANVLREDSVGVALDSFDDDALREGGRRLLELACTPGIRERCVEVARRNFSLDEGVARYRAVYRSLAGNS